ncbi:MAG: NYN domain-containing protein [Peptostreptococcaceae bacterium]|nr:NYN domain-containing protein [Peptostreptococcaceae bacterium]
MKQIRNNVLLIDGYNIINAWGDLAKIAGDNLEEARRLFNDKISEYAQYNGIDTYIVYDAYKVRGVSDREEKIKKLTIIFTKENQTADSYIEKFIHDYKYKRHAMIRVATNDLTEQNMVLGKGAARLTARELLLEVEQSKESIRRIIKEGSENRYTLGQRLDKETFDKLEKLRRS